MGFLVVVCVMKSKFTVQSKPLKIVRTVLYGFSGRYFEDLDDEKI